MNNRNEPLHIVDEPADSIVASGLPEFGALGRTSLELQRLRMAATAMIPIRAAIQTCLRTAPCAKGLAASRLRATVAIISPPASKLP